MQTGISKYFAKLKTLSPRGKATTPQKLDAVFQDDIDQTQALGTLLGQVAEQRVKQRAARALAVQSRSDVKAYILGNYGEGDEVATMLNDFGYGTPKKRSTPTAATKAQAVVQAQATRKARGIVAKKDRAKAVSVTTTPAAAATVTK